MISFFKFLWERITLADLPRGSGRSTQVPMNIEAVNHYFGRRGDTDFL
jgi:hypothetical protein